MLFSCHRTLNGRKFVSFILVATHPENESKVYMKCKCFKSLKKNEDPHQLKVSIYIYIFFLFMKTEVAIRTEVLFSTFCSFKTKLKKNIYVNY